MNVFYTREVAAGYAHLSDEEARHCVQVLRRQVGDEVMLIDGNGRRYKGILSETSKKRCIVEIQSFEIIEPLPPCHLHIAIAPTKNMNRIEWMVEKATEIGVSEITPVLCQHSERRKLRLDRLKKTALAAMKQSLKATLPIINDLTPFSKLVAGDCKETMKFIARGDQKNSLKDNYLPPSDVLILIGPEGDFSEEEYTLAIKHGFEGVNMGKSRLRTETAGIIACHTINLLNQ